MGNSTASDERIRNEAYRLWEEAGRPHGRDAEFWQQAAALVEHAPPSVTSTSAPAKAASATAAKPRKKAAEPVATAASPRRRPRKAGTQPNTPSA